MRRRAIVSTPSPEHDPELVRREPADAILAAQGAADAPPDDGDHLVADVVAIEELEAKAPIRFITRGVDMLKGEEVDALIDVVREAFPRDAFVVLDTLARNFGGGDENRQQDMNAFVKGGDALRAGLPGSTLLVVHHAGKNRGQGDRGSSVLRGAVDAKMELVRLVEKDTGRRTDKLILKCVTQKDAPECSTIYLRLACGGEGFSCTIEERDAPKDKNSIDVERAARVALEVLTEHPEGLAFMEWRAATGEPGIPKSTLQGIRDHLIEAGKVEKMGKRYKLVAAAPAELAGPVEMAA
jgi:hypothetical protein